MKFFFALTLFFLAQHTFANDKDRYSDECELQLFSNQEQAGFWNDRPGALDEVVGKIGFDSNPDGAELVEWLKKRRGSLEGLRITDVGIGNGRTLQYIQNQLPKSARITAVEYDKKNAEWAREKWKSVENVEIVSDSILTVQLQFLQDGFHLLFSVFWEFNVKEQEQLIKHLVNHLKPSGYIVIDVPGPDRPLNFISAESRIIRYSDPVNQRKTDGSRILHSYAITEQELLRLANKNGLDLESKTYSTSRAISRTMYFLTKKL